MIIIRSAFGRIARGYCRKIYITLTIFSLAWVFTMITARTKPASPTSGKMHSPKQAEGVVE
jgi:hypothetical protein